MRIALVVTEYVTEENFDGGLANYTRRLALALSRAGHDPVVFVESGQDSSFVHEGIRVERVKYRRVFLFAALNLLTFRRLQFFFNFLRHSWNLNAALKKSHRVAPFDIVQFTHLGGIGIFRPKSIPAVARLSSYIPLWAQHGEYASRSHFQVWQQAVLEDLALKRVDAIFGPCLRVNKYVERKLAIPVWTIESPFLLGTDSEDDSVYRERLADKRYVLYYGRLNRPKGILLITAILRRLLKGYPDLFFVFAGRDAAGSDGRTMMSLLVEQAGEFRERVFYLGRIPQSQLIPVIRNAAAITLPALIENFPNTCLEAMALGQIVVATAGTGFDQLIRHGESGLLCRADDPASLLEAVEVALKMPQESREAMGRAARSRMEGLKPELIADRHVELYHRIMESLGNKNDRKKG